LQISGLFEFVLEVADLSAAERFYVGDLGLPIAGRWAADRPALWLSPGREVFLGLWPIETCGAKAILQARGGTHVHFALRVSIGSLDDFAQHLQSLGHEVETGWDFGNGNRAIYVHDPDENVVERTERTALWDGATATN